MEKDKLVWEYIKSRKWFLEAELKRSRESLDEIIGWGDPKWYAHEIGRLESRIESYEDELEALKGLWTKLHDIDSAKNGWYQGRWEEGDEE